MIDDSYGSYYDRGEERRRQQNKKSKVEKGFLGKTYVYRGDSADEEESDLEEAGYDDIMEEEFVSGRIAEQEEEQEA